MKARAGAGEARSTAAVLWLMIMLVFLPIAAIHGLARLREAALPEPEARHASLATGVATPVVP